ncbi:hypothetical protein WKI65_18725 [Streptomyces sp. MS1.AVA.3]|uniref:hypothetical protein n=1 Tax=Streptomyces decoyicus TaxID=249567 RepID=UPI0030BC4BA7
MPDLPDPPDYFDRLLARYAPAPGGAAPAAPGGGRTGGARRTLVQPRLPGPFERIEALRGTPAEPDEPAPLYPQAPGAWLPGDEHVRYEREIRTTERQTVLRSEAPRLEAAHDPGGHQHLRPVASLLRPAVSAEPGPRSAAPGAVRPQQPDGARAGDGGTVRPAASTLVLPGLESGSLAAVSPLRPHADGLPTARNAARGTSAGRRGQRGGERVVHVQIGRLEVSAAGTEPPAAGGRPARAERRAPSLSLADYLARGERTN